MFKKKLVVKKLRKYLKKLYEGYPTHFFYGYEKVNGIEDGIKHLIEDRIIKEQEFENGYASGKTPSGSIILSPIMSKKYRLTAEGLKLVDGWYIERLTHWIIGLSIITLFLGLAQIFLKFPIRF